MGEYVPRITADGTRWMQYVPAPWETRGFWADIARWTLSIISVGCFIAYLILK
jgi:hypothetical protein